MRLSVGHNSQWCWWPSDKQTAVTVLWYNHCQNVDCMFLFPVLFWKYCLPPLCSNFHCPTLVNRLSISPVRCFPVYWKTPAEHSLPNSLCIWAFFFCFLCMNSLLLIFGFFLLYFRYNLMYFESIKNPLLITILHPFGQLIIIYFIMLIPEGSRFDPVWSVIACVYFLGSRFLPQSKDTSVKLRPINVWVSPSANRQPQTPTTLTSLKDKVDTAPLWETLKSCLHGNKITLWFINIAIDWQVLKCNC